ncbi:AMP-dependent synthetase/ligase [Micrococcoides hystricis]|uniref:AMP-dependent synthetase/ligase n=1 Tax=Micrococcoides hystricis TaxID=1572761 RepID=A0ABV6PA98_9MICC
MQEVTNTQVAQLPASTNVTDLVLERLEAAADLPAYAIPTIAGEQITWRDVTLREFVTDVQKLAKALIASGVKPGDMVAVMCSTSYKWALLDQAIWFAGGISVPIYETSSAYQVEHIVGDSGASLLFVETEQHRGVAAQALANLGADLPIHVIGELADLMAFAETGHEVSDADLDKARRTATLADVATLVYTSGTTGRPKGARITHANLCLTSLNILPFAADIVYPEGEGAEQSSSLMFLPLAHILARAVQYICLVGGIKIGHVGDLKLLLPALNTFNPSFVLAVPRVFEKVLAGATQKAEDGGKGKIFAAAKQTAIDYAQACERADLGEGSGPGLALKLKHKLFDKLVYAKLRALLGSRAKFAVSGASTLDPELGAFFRGVGIGMQEGYGLTETTAPATLNIPGQTTLGSVGLPIPGVDIKIADDQEILIRGVVVFDGYHGDRFSTEETFTADGFLRTGDLGEIDESGFLKILGRKKDVIVTAGGKNVYPGPMEEDLRKDDLVAHVVLVGENRPFVSALIALEPEALPRWCAQHGLGELSVQQAAEHPQIRDYVENLINDANQKVSRAESVREFRILPAALTDTSGHLTPSMKLQRTAVMRDYTEVIDEIYGKN